MSLLLLTHVSPVCLSLSAGPALLLWRWAPASGLDSRTRPLFLQISVSFSLRSRNEDRHEAWAQVKHTVFLLLYIQRIKSKCDWVMDRLLFWSHNCRFETQPRCSVMIKHQKCVVRYQHFEDTLKALTLAVRSELCHIIAWIELKENKQIKVPVSVVQPSITHVVVQQQGTLCTTMCQQVFGVEQLSVEDVPGH